MKVLSLVIAGLITVLAALPVAAYTGDSVENYYAYDLIDITKTERKYLKQFLQQKYNVTIPVLTDAVWEGYRSRHEAVLRYEDSRSTRGTQFERFLRRKENNYAGVNRTQEQIDRATEILLQELRKLEQKNEFGDQGVATKILGDREAREAEAETKDFLEKKLATQEFIAQGYGVATGKPPPLPSDCPLSRSAVQECDPLNKMAFDELANLSIKILTEKLHSTAKDYAEIRDDFNRNFNSRLPLYVEKTREKREQRIQKDIAQLKRYLAQPTALRIDKLLPELSKYISGNRVDVDKIKGDLSQKEKDLATLEEDLAEEFSGMLENQFTHEHRLNSLRKILETTKTFRDEFERTGSEPLGYRPPNSARRVFIVRLRTYEWMTKYASKNLGSYHRAMQKIDNFESSMSSREKKSILRKFAAKRNRGKQ